VSLSRDCAVGRHAGEGFGANRTFSGLPWQPLLRLLLGSRTDLNEATRLERICFRSNRCRIPAVEWSARAAVLAAVALLDKVIDQLAGRIVHLDVEGFHLASEVVEGHNRGDGYQQTESCGYQGFRDTAGDCTDA
jgi:hypothetical protein